MITIRVYWVKYPINFIIKCGFAMLQQLWRIEFRLYFYVMNRENSFQKVSTKTTTYLYNMIAMVKDVFNTETIKTDYKLKPQKLFQFSIRKWFHLCAFVVEMKFSIKMKYAYDVIQHFLKRNRKIVSGRF